MSENNKLVPVKSTKKEEVLDEDSSLQNEEPEVYEKRVPAKRSFVVGIVVGVLALGFAIGILLMGWYYIDSESSNSEDYPAEQTETAMVDNSKSGMKADKLSPTRIYTLGSATDSFNGLSLTITKAQFRQDVTRLWIKVDNNSGKKISMLTGSNSSLVDSQGHTYKVDPFASDKITDVAPGAHEEILVVFDPVRADTTSVTYNLDGVFDLKNSSWNYQIQFNLP